MNLGIILPLVIYLVFIFGAALFVYVKRSKGDFLTEYYVGNRSMTGFVLAMTTASTYASASSLLVDHQRMHENEGYTNPGQGHRRRTG